MQGLWGKKKTSPATYPSGGLDLVQGGRIQHARVLIPPTVPIPQASELIDDHGVVQRAQGAALTVMHTQVQWGSSRSAKAAKLRNVIVGHAREVSAACCTGQSHPTVPLPNHITMHRGSTTGPGLVGGRHAQQMMRCWARRTGKACKGHVHMILSQATHPGVNAVHRWVGVPQLRHHFGIGGDGVEVTGRNSKCV